MIHLPSVMTTSKSRWPTPISLASSSRHLPSSFWMMAFRSKFSLRFGGSPVMFTGLFKTYSSVNRRLEPRDACVWKQSVILHTYNHDYSAVYILAVLCVSRGGHWLCMSEYSITNNKRMNRKINYSSASAIEDEENETKQIIIMQITSTDDSKP